MCLMGVFFEESQLSFIMEDREQQQPLQEPAFHKSLCRTSRINFTGRIEFNVWALVRQRHGGHA